MPRGRNQGRGLAMQRITIADRARNIIRRKSTREELIEKCGDKAFLDPTNLRFPIVNPLSGKCDPDCKLVHAAYVRAKQFHYEDLAAKAASIYKSHDCEKKTGIKIHE